MRTNILIFSALQCLFHQIALGQIFSYTTTENGQKLNHRILMDDYYFVEAHERGDTIIRNTPMRRFGKAEELNGAIHFLCSDAAQFITGVVIPIDGGFSAFSGV